MWTLISIFYHQLWITVFENGMSLLTLVSSLRSCKNQMRTTGTCMVYHPSKTRQFSFENLTILKCELFAVVYSLSHTNLKMGNWHFHILWFLSGLFRWKSTILLLRVLIMVFFYLFVMVGSVVFCPSNQFTFHQKYTYH